MIHNGIEGRIGRLKEAARMLDNFNLTSRPSIRINNVVASYQERKHSSKIPNDMPLRPLSPKERKCDSQ